MFFFIVLGPGPCQMEGHRNLKGNRLRRSVGLCAINNMYVEKESGLNHSGPSVKKVSPVSRPSVKYNLIFQVPTFDRFALASKMVVQL